MKGKYRIIHLIASVVIEIACVYVMCIDSQLHGQQNSDFEHGVTPLPTPESRPNKFCSCGEETKLEGERIIGGKTVDPPNRYPFVVLLMENNSFFCGGTLISRLYVLTAAHCLYEKYVSNVSIALGAHYIDYNPDLVSVSEFIIHPDFYNGTLQHDIALVRLSSPVHLTKTIGLACLAMYPKFTSLSDLATVTGWGAIDPNGTIVSYELQELQVSIVSNALCLDRMTVLYPELGLFPETKICAGGVEGKGTCKGDSGGPLFVKYDGQLFIVGVPSWIGEDCGLRGYPDGYTRVSAYLDWISNHTQDSPPCDAKEMAPPLETNLENCGIPDERAEGRIAGGTEAGQFEFPWIARIVYNESFAGIGSLISPTYVLTVASIFDNWYHEMIIETRFVDVFLGRHRISVVEPKFRKFDVEEASRPTSHNIDLALLKLKVPATGMPDIYRPICLPTAETLYSPELKLTTAGWGRISKSGPVSDVLLKADMFVEPKESCFQRNPGRITENIICAYKNGTDTCEGDKGAPLMMLYYGFYYLTGLSSWESNNDCATPGEPIIFSAVHSNIVWIRSIIDHIVA